MSLQAGEVEADGVSEAGSTSRHDAQPVHAEARKSRNWKARNFSVLGSFRDKDVQAKKPRQKIKFSI